MQVLTDRQKLINYLAYADDRIIEALYVLLEKEIEKKETPTSTEEPTIVNILRNEYVVISVVGPHAGESLSKIFFNKGEELKKNGKTYWLISSRKARTEKIQEFCSQAKSEGRDVYCLFITSGTQNGSQQTKNEDTAKHISYLQDEWVELDDNVITGKIDKQSSALVLSELEVLNKPIEIDLWEYSELDNSSIKIQRGASTILGKKTTSIPGMKSRFRSILAFGKLNSPHAVWVR